MDPCKNNHCREVRELLREISENWSEVMMKELMSKHHETIAIQVGRLRNRIDSVLDNDTEN